MYTTHTYTEPVADSPPNKKPRLEDKELKSRSDDTATANGQSKYVS